MLQDVFDHHQQQLRI
ncbi:hypothetical protein CICLE_v100049801mg, partial [Citrus x clementina]